MSSNLKHTWALELVTDRWALWILLTVDEHAGSRFSDLMGEPGLSRRVLADRLRRLVDAALLATRAYQQRPVRHRYLLTARGAQVRRHALATIHVAAGGVLVDDPLQPAAPLPADAQHPADALLAGDLQAAARIHESTVAPLARYDSQYRTSLLETLETWLACDGSVSVAAARLYAHRHTVRYRLDRIKELAGLDVDATADREQLTLGLRARRVLAAAGRLDG